MSRLITVLLVVLLSAPAALAQEAQRADQLMEAAKWSMLMFRDEDALWAAREALKVREDFDEARVLAEKLEVYVDPKRLEAAADAGDAGAMFRMGDRFLEGKGVAADAQKALAWYRKAAEAGEARALWRLGVMLSRGMGIERNPADAVECFRAAATAGDAWAKYSLAGLLLGGQGVARDVKEAGQLLREAAEAGVLPAMRELIWISEQGTSAAAKREAAAWRKRLNGQVERMTRLLPQSPHIALDMSNIHLAENQLDQAVDVLREAAGRLDHSELHERLAELLLRQGKADDAIKSLRAQLDKQPDNTRLRVLLVRALMAKRDHRGALAEADRVIQQDPGSAVTHYYRGQIQNALGDGAAAVASFRRACELSPDNAPMRAMLAGVLERQKKYDEAIAEFERLAAAGDQRAMGYEGIIRIRIIQENWAEAERVLDRVEKEMAKDAHWPSMRVQMWLRRDDPARALAAAKQAAELAPENNGIQAQYLELLLTQEKGPDRVLRESDAAASGPDGWRITVVRGLARAQLKQPDLAAAEFDRAMYLVDVARNDMAAEVVAAHMVEAIGAEQAIRRMKARKQDRWLMGLALAQLERQEWEGAEKTADELMALVEGEHPEHARQRALWFAAQLYGGAAETRPTLAKAEQAYLKYIRTVENEPELRDAYITAMNNLAYMLADHPTTPDASKALTYSQKAWDLMGTGDGYKPFVADTQGWVLVQLGRLDEGIAVLKDAIARGEESAEMSYHLGEALRRKGQSKEALAELEKARELLKKEKRISPLVSQRIDESILKIRNASRPAAAPDADQQD